MKSPILDYLTKKGLEAKWRGKTAYFSSPLRPGDKNKSFAVTPGKTRSGKDVWFDHGLGRGGDGYDLVKEVENCNFPEAKKILDDLGVAPTQALVDRQLALSEHTGKREIQERQDLQNKVLIQYLEKRKISLRLAQKYLKEIHFRYPNNPKLYYTLGFENDSGGYEFRNKGYKSSHSPKDISSIKGKNPDSGILVVFEAFMDFLSGLEYWKQDRPENNTIVLNTASLVGRLKDKLEKYREIHCFLDRDRTGKETLEKIKKMAGNREVKDRSTLYSEYKDFNEYWVKED